MIKVLVACVATLALIGGLVLERSYWPQPEDVEEYHAAVAEAIADVPEEIEGWTATEVELPTAAVALLRPNAILSRRYENPVTGRAFSFLIVHCRDARDMIGHYPPVCYTGAGWELRQQQDEAWAFQQPEPVHVKGVHYEFEQLLPGSASQLRVTNLIILPDGVFGRTMRDVNRIAADRSLRVYGAGQVQFVFNSNFSDSEREQVIKTFTAAAMPVVEAIQTGVQE